MSPLRAAFGKEKKKMIKKKKKDSYWKICLCKSVLKVNKELVVFSWVDRLFQKGVSEQMNVWLLKLFVARGDVRLLCTADLVRTQSWFT